MSKELNKNQGLEMAINDLSLYNGMLGSLIVIVGVFFTLIIFKSYLSSRNKQTLALGIMVFGSSTAWSSAFFNIIIYFVGGNLIVGETFAFVTFAFFPLVFPSIIYVSINIIKAEQLKIWLIGSLILMILLYIEVYVFYPLRIIGLDAITTITPATAESFPENTYEGYALLYVSITIIAGLIFGILILRVGLNSEINLVRARGILLGMGLITFSFLAIIDGIFALDLIGSFFFILILARIGIIVGIYLMYLGVITPNYVRTIFKISNES